MELQITEAVRILPQSSAVKMRRQRGVVLERWDGVEGYLVRRLLQDPRFPSLPSYAAIVPTFSEPNNWGDNYGSRLRGYFVPQQSGPHYFVIGILT